VTQLRDTAAHVVVDASEFASAATPGAVLSPSDDVATHLAGSLRLRDGETVSVTDGAGRWALTTVRRAGPRLDLVGTGNHGEVARDGQVTIAAAIPKGDRLDWMVQKVTELGVDRLVLLHADRSVVRWDADRAGRQLDRARRVSLEACRQSRRCWLLRIEGPVPSAGLPDGAVLAEPGGRPIAPTDRVVAIGPEGGWTDRELALGPTVSLGSTVLRTETAALAAATLCVVGRHENWQSLAP
jgi:16S rRNA (uracil1498-N3)-methyltransferase